MSTDLRDKIASALYLFTEQADQGTPGWDELIANHGEDYETIVAYRNMADFVMPVVEREMAAIESISESWPQTAAAMTSRLLEAERKLDETRTELGRLRRETAAYRASVRAAHHSCDECPDRRDEKPQESQILVEGSWFDRDDLPRILANHMRQLAEAEQSLKEIAPVTSTEPGCTCNGMASCEQCQERDARDDEMVLVLKGKWFIPGGCDICGKPSTHVTTPGGMRGCDDHFGGRS